MGRFFGTQICQWQVVTGRILAADQPPRAISSFESGSTASEEQDNSHIFGQRDSHVLPQQGGGGGSRSVPLNRLKLDILIFCQDHGFFLIPAYHPVEADLSVDDRIHRWISLHHSSRLTFTYISPYTGRRAEQKDQCSGSEVEGQEEVSVSTSFIDSA